MPRRTNMRSWWDRLRHRNRLEREMDAEMRFHIEMEAERLMREERLAPEEARRMAHVRFGGVEKFKEAGRDTRGWQWIDAISIDARLGVRMLVKHRWLTLVGGFAMAVAIAIVATVFEFTKEVLDPALPVQDGDRVVTIQYATSSPGRPERRVLYELPVWRSELRSIEQVSAFRRTQHNLVTGSVPEPIKVAEMTASGFAVARVPPLMGRYLLPSDDREGAPPVVVIGYDAWQSRFAGDPRIVGRTLNLAGVAYEVIGVMPPRFKFPVNHQFWIPLRADPLTHRRWEGPSLYVFGRLAKGATLESAQAELTTIARRAAFAHPELQEQLRPLVLPYTREYLDLADPEIVLVLQIARFLVGMLCLVVAVNLAILVYARTATRLGEIAVRTALGASRRRILAQLFVEALALSLVGAAAGLALARIGIEPVRSVILSTDSLPYWIDLELSWQTALFTLGLAIIAAAIMGVLPGLKATGRKLHANLQELNGRSGTRLGPMWTGLVVAQVAIAVAVLPVALFLSWQAVRMELSGPGFAAEQFLVASATLSDDAGVVDKTRIGPVQRALISRLQAEPGVSAVTFSSFVPGFGGDRRIEFEEGALSRDEGPQDVSVLLIDLEMFKAYDARIVAGRALDSSDLGAANAVVVNSSFVRKFIGNRGPLGVRFRYVEPQSPERRADWYHIVGVVRDFPGFSPAPGSDGAQPTVYRPAAIGDLHPLLLSVRFAGPIPPGAIERVRQIGAEVDPSLQLRRVLPLTKYYDDLRALWRYLAWGIGAVTLSVLLLSAAGIYALMSFTVAQRTREIGIRAALGAHPRRLLVSIFGRVLRQLALGVILGSLLSGGLMVAASLGAAKGVALLLSVAGLMSLVGVLAALGPARRSLRIPAMQALRTDG
jgi:putative ABC transport system permease protein